ncbi:MAG TPA: hypothetical protein VFV94_00385 [Polyangiaceae bacterium]|nr:hypothetical protein [Polyangiaceae bacterium]
MATRAYSTTSVALLTLAGLALGCSDRGDDDSLGSTAGTGGSTMSAAGTSNAGTSSSNGGAGSGQGGQGGTAGGSTGGSAGNAAAGGSAGSGLAGMSTGGSAGMGMAGGGSGRGGAAGSTSMSGTGGGGGMTPGLDTCPMPPDGTPDASITALNTENTLRLAMGLDCAAIAPALVKSAQAHCDYYTQNQGDDMCEAPSPHDEIEGCPGFTGEGLGERFKAAGYMLSGGGSECMAFIDDPERAVMTFVNSVYHRTPILDPWMRDFGYGHSDGCDTIDFGTGTKSDKTKTAVYPYQGQTGVPTSFDGSREGPEPPEPPTGWPSGLPITVYAQNFTVESHVITLDGSTDPIAHQWLDEDDPTLPSYAKFLYTDAPMMANTTYHVVVTGTLSGTAKTFDWTFTTGAATGGGRPRP